VPGHVLTVASISANTQTANGGYYENSIAHTVEQRRRHLSAYQSSHQDQGRRIRQEDFPLPHHTLGSNAFTAGGKRVTGVNFEMWMSPNQGNMDKRLHDFTSPQSARDLPRCDPSPLENVQNWRSSYPCLAATLDKKSDIPKFDIIMIETSYMMMSEFPPPKATLGLRLELDFGQTYRGELFDWTCTTHIYRKGVPVKQASFYRLEEKGGNVAPPFDSMWWALTFIDKIEQKKQAEETGKRDEYHATQARTHQFFSQLTAVHEIRARSQSGSGFQDPLSERGLVAVLIWKFSIAPETYVGTTSWQRLLLPPARITTNSPSPNEQEMSLPPLAMDTAVEGLNHSTDFSDNKELLTGQAYAQYADYHASVDHSNPLLSHNDFEMTFKEDDIANFASMQSSFMPSTHGEHEGQTFHTLDHFDYDIHLHGLETPSQHNAYPPASSNIFETQHVSQDDIHEAHHRRSQGHLYGLHQDFEHDADGTTQRRPLATFDHNTHNMLQAQLAHPTLDQSKQENANEKLRAALAAASAMNDLGNRHMNLPHLPASQSEKKQEHLSALWEDNPLQRPQLHTHPSFTSHVSYTSHHEHETTVGSQVGNSNAFHANHIDEGLDGHEYDPSTSSPEMRRLLQMHNHAFAEDEHQQHATAESKEEFENRLGGGLVLAEADRVEQDAQT